MLRTTSQARAKALNWNQTSIPTWCSALFGLTLIACSTPPKPIITPVESNPSAIKAPVIDETPVVKIVRQEPVVKKPRLTTESTPNPVAPNTPKPAKKPPTKNPEAPRQKNIPLPEPVMVDRISRTGKLESRKLNEASGLTASKNSPGVLYAINDSGDSATLYALSETGQHIGQWTINARNRDWEDLDTVELNNQNYVLIGDTGDNLRIHRKSTFYLVAEPLPGQLNSKPITPYMAIDFVYEDGPRNVEAFAVYGKTIFLISKEPVGPVGTTASRVYSLEIPSSQPSTLLTAKFMAELPVLPTSLESKLAASFAGVDLNHITAMDISNSGRTAYLLTYRHVHKLERRSNESWTAAFQRKGEKIHSHSLKQAEALTIAPGRAVFFTSEKRGAPLWSIPIQAAP